LEKKFLLVIPLRVSPFQEKKLLSRSKFGFADEDIRGLRYFVLVHEAIFYSLLQ